MATYSVVVTCHQGSLRLAKLHTDCGGRACQTKDDILGTPTCIKFDVLFVGEANLTLLSGKARL